MNSSPQESFGPEHAPVVRVPDQPDDSDQQPDGIEAGSADTGPRDSDDAILDAAGQPTPSDPGEPSA